MSAYLNAAIEELKDLIQATWDDLEVQAGPDARIWEAEHIAAIPFDAIVAPACILVVDNQPWTAGPTSRNDEFLDCEIYRIQKSPGSPAPLRTALGPLRDALRTACQDHSSTNFQVWDDPFPMASWSLKMDINRLLRGKKLPLLGGRVQVRLLTGEPS